MLYRFRSKAGADVIMTAPHGDRVLRAAGREPAPQGIFTLEQLAPAMAAIDAAIAQPWRAKSPPPPHSPKSTTPTPKKWKWTSNDTPKSKRSPAEKSQTAIPKCVVA